MALTTLISLHRLNPAAALTAGFSMGASVRNHAAGFAELFVKEALFEQSMLQWH